MHFLIISYFKSEVHHFQLVLQLCDFQLLVFIPVSFYIDVTFLYIKFSLMGTFQLHSGRGLSWLFMLLYTFKGPGSCRYPPITQFPMSGKQLCCEDIVLFSQNIFWAHRGIIKGLQLKQSVFNFHQIELFTAIKYQKSPTHFLHALDGDFLETDHRNVFC